MRRGRTLAGLLGRAITNPPVRRAAGLRTESRMISIDPSFYDCAYDDKPARFHIVWLTYADGFGAAGMWNGRQWWPVRRQGDPVSWRELRPKELSATVDSAT